MDQRIFRDFDELKSSWPLNRPAGKVVFTNGCFDILHVGHVSYLEEARALGEFLVLGLNSDSSVQALKGPKRPLNPFQDRAGVLAGLRSVDLVVGFDQETPLALIEAIEPDVLVKGGDWAPSQIVGSDFVQARGGLVRNMAFKSGKSTTGVLELILERYANPSRTS